MTYPAGHRSMVRRKIIESARRLFNRRGFENVSITEIMGGAGLTHGGFYSYFKSKSDLYAEVLGCFFTDPEWTNCWEGVHVDLSSTNVGPQIIRAYLSRQHFDDIENSCPMVSLPTDVARSDATARRAFETVFKAMVDVLERSLKGRRGIKKERRMLAQGIAALSVGGMILARTIDDRALADDLRTACTEVALNIGGWSNKRISKNAGYWRHGYGEQRRPPGSVPSSANSQVTKSSGDLAELPYPSRHRVAESGALPGTIPKRPKCRNQLSF